jgi:uncharacterized RDD family membrane protein YckC
MACRECGAETNSRICINCADIKLGFKDPIGASSPHANYSEDEGRNILLLRVLAFFIDGLIYGVIAFIVAAFFVLLIPVILSGQSTDINNLEELGSLGLVIAGMLITYFLFIFLLTGLSYLHYAGTPGKALLGIKVININDGSDRNSFLKGLAREFIGKNISYFLLGGGFIMILFNQERAGLHDYLFGTLVVSNSVNSDSDEFLDGVGNEPKEAESSEDITKED